MHKPPRGSLLNRAHPLARGLVGCWIMNEGTGDRSYDLSGHGNHGCLTNMDPPTDWVAGPFGSALDFDGVNDLVDCGTDPSLNITSTKITCELWFWAKSIVSYGGLLFRCSSGSWNDGYGIYTRTGPARLFFFVSHYTNAAVINLSDTTSWHHVASTYDGADVRIYLDGVEGTPYSYTGNIASGTGPFIIGAAYGPNPIEFNGQIGLARVWDRTLSCEEALGLYRDPVGMFGYPAPVWLPSAFERLGPTAFRNRTQRLSFADSTERLSFRDATQRIEPVSDVS